MKGTVDSAIAALVKRALETGEVPEKLADTAIRDIAPTLAQFVSPALDRHRSLGITSDISLATLRDVGRKITIYDNNIDVEWLIGLMRGDVLEIGRLQYERTPIDGFRRIHIPEGDSLDQVCVSESLQRAVELLGADPMECTSWILDPALQDLGFDSNLVKFASRFDVVPRVANEIVASPGAATDIVDHPGDQAVCRFVFRRAPNEVRDEKSVFPKTRLQRLVASYLRAGYHWSEPRGTLVNVSNSNAQSFSFERKTAGD